MTVGDKNAAAWLIGHEDCEGSLGDRKHSTDRRCSGALLAKYADLIQPNVSPLAPSTMFELMCA